MNKKNLLYLENVLEPQQLVKIDQTLSEQINDSIVDIIRSAEEIQTNKELQFARNHLLEIIHFLNIQYKSENTQSKAIKETWLKFYEWSNKIANLLEIFKKEKSLYENENKKIFLEQKKLELESEKIKVEILKKDWSKYQVILTFLASLISVFTSFYISYFFKNDKISELNKMLDENKIALEKKDIEYKHLLEKYQLVIQLQQPNISKNKKGP